MFWQCHYDGVRLLEGHGNTAGAGEGVIPGEEVVVADVERRGDEGTDVDPRAVAEQDAVGVDQEDLAVGGELAIDSSAAGTSISAIIPRSSLFPSPHV